MDNQPPARRGRGRPPNRRRGGNRQIQHIQYMQNLRENEEYQDAEHMRRHEQYQNLRENPALLEIERARVRARTTRQRASQEEFEEGEETLNQEMDVDQPDQPAQPVQHRRSNRVSVLSERTARERNRARMANQQAPQQQEEEEMSQDDEGMDVDQPVQPAQLDQSAQHTQPAYSALDDISRLLNNFTGEAGNQKLDKAKKFDDAQKAIKFIECKNKHPTDKTKSCQRWFPDLPVCKKAGNKLGFCSPCTKDETMFVSPNLVISDVPEVLKKLTFIEQMLIAQVHPVVQFYRIRNAQVGYRGNVISFVQNITECYSTLPLLPADLAKVIMFTKDTVAGTAYFKANRENIMAALRWLNVNNEYYQYINISEENANLIPADGDMHPVLLPYAINYDAPENEATNEGVTETFVPHLLPADQQQRIDRQFQMPYPELADHPVDEFTTEGYIAKAFPCLFPDGKGDFLFPRAKKLTRKEYILYLLMYKDRRFIKDQRFCYFGMNTLLRHQAMSYAGVAVQKNALNGQTVQTIRQLMIDNPHFLSKIMVFAANLRSTRPYWAQRTSELLDMVTQLGCPTIFFTLSAADYHWPDLFRLLCEGTNTNPDTLEESDRRKLMHDNPDIVAFFVQERFRLFREKVLIPIFEIIDFWMR